MPHQRPTRPCRRLLPALLLLPIALAGPAPARADSLTQATLVGTTLRYIDVIEDTATPPVPLGAGSAPPRHGLPVSPGAHATRSGSVEVVDGSLVFVIETVPWSFLESVVFSEIGDPTLASQRGPAGFGSIGSADLAARLRRMLLGN